MKSECDMQWLSVMFMCVCARERTSECVAANRLECTRCTVEYLKLETLNSYVPFWRRRCRLFSNSFRRARCWRRSENSTRRRNKLKRIRCTEDGARIGKGSRRYIVTCEKTESVLKNRGQKVLSFSPNVFSASLCTLRRCTSHTRATAHANTTATHPRRRRALIILSQQIMSFEF